MKKRWMVVLIAVVMLFFVSPVSSLAARAEYARGGVMLEESATAEVTPTPTVAPSPSPTRVRANSVSLKNLSANLYLGKTGTVGAEVVPYNANANGLADFTWSSSNTSVLTIEEEASDDIYAAYKAVGTGTATVTVKVDGLSASVTVTVTQAHVESLSLENLPTTLYMGGQCWPFARVEPSEANYNGLADFTWSSSNTSVLTIREHADDYIVTGDAVGTGTATVTVKVGGLSASATVTVTQAHVESLSLKYFPTKINLGKKGAVEASFAPSQANYNGIADFTWSSSNTSVLKVEEYADDYVVGYEAVGTGTATVTVKANGLSASATVTVTQAHVESLSIGGLPANLYLGRSDSTYATVVPSEADYKGLVDFTWSSSNTSVITIKEETGDDRYADYEAVGPGTATVTVKADGLSASVTVTVTRAYVESLSLEYLPTNLNVSQGGWAYVNFEPYEANTNGLADFTWSSSNTSVITVAEWASDDRYADYKAAGPGTATVTVKVDGVSASITVTVSGTPTPTIAPTPTVTATSAASRPPSSAGVVTTTPVSTKDLGGNLPSPTRVPVVLEADGWEAIEQAAGGLGAGSLGSIQAPGDTLLPISLLETLRQNQSALEIDCGGYFCIIDGAMLAEIPNDLETIDIGMTMEKDSALSAAWGCNAYELRFNYHGELPGTFTFRVKAQGSRTGDTIYLYYFDDSAGEFEGVHTAVVDDEGYVSLNITHCSSYYITNAIIADAVNNFTVPAETEAAEAQAGFAAFVQKNKAVFWLSVYFLSVGVIVLLVVLIRRGMKRSGKLGAQREEPVKHTYIK